MAKRRRRKKRLNVFRFIVFIFCFIILCAGLGAGVVVYASTRDMPALTAESLKTIAHTIIYDQDGNYITQIGVRNSEPIPLADVPPDLKNAVLAIEDPGFYKHRGFSLRGIVRAAFVNAQSGTLKEGGSTITQQLVKISFLTDARTIERKIQELFLSVEVERRYTKDEILEMYLNNTYMGEGAYGMQAAAQTFFGVDLTDDKHSLTLEQAALLAGLPQAPSAYSPFSNPELALNRRNLVLDAMARNDYISESEAQAAKATDLELDSAAFIERQYPYPYFVDYITDVLVEKYGETEVFKGGLRVYTSLDQNIQRIAEAAMSNNANFPSSNTDANDILQPQGAVVVLDPATGQIKALVGGREHVQKRQWNRAVQSTRQPGSSFKPIIAYAPAIDLMDMAPASVFDDSPVTYGPYTPRNNDGRYRGLITMRDALTSSINIIAVKVLMDTVGMDAAVSFASGLGIQLDPNYHGPSMALGGLYEGVSPLQMAAAYAAFANMGEYNEPTAIIKVDRNDGTLLDKPNPKHRQAMKDTTAYLITSMLENVIQRGTGTRAQIGRPAAGKTGTTDEGKDVWFVGFTPDLVCSVWIGYDNPTPMPFAYGGIYPAAVWHEVMSNALQNKPVSDFTRPPGIISATVDRRTGLPPGPNTSPEDLVTDLFRDGTVPTEEDDRYITIEVCAESGLLPTPYCPIVTTRTVLNLPSSDSTSVEDRDSRVPTELCDIHNGSGRPQNMAIPGIGGSPATNGTDANSTNNPTGTNSGAGTTGTGTTGTGTTGAGTTGTGTTGTGTTGTGSTGTGSTGTGAGGNSAPPPSEPEDDPGFVKSPPSPLGERWLPVIRTND